MKLKKIHLLFAFISFGLFAQEPITWSTELIHISDSQIEVKFNAQIAENWHLYGIDLPKNGPVPTKFIFEVDSLKYSLDGVTEQSKPIIDYDPIFEMDLSFFKNQASFSQRINILEPSIASISLEINYQACNDQVCIFRAEPLIIILDEAKAKLTPLEIDDYSISRSKALVLNLKNKEFLKTTLTESEKESPLLNLFLLGFLGGLIALLTPCVFPMIPLTVSFFLKQSSSLKKGIINASLYGFFIVAIYIALSLPFHFIDNLNPEILNSISTNVPLNLFFFAIFVFFAFSFFGYYELRLPSSWGNKIDSRSSMTNGLGILFMSLTLAIVSFSCTGPILGSLLVGSLTSEGGAMQLTIGMTGFGTALALPFVLFALFPNILNALPKSGGWMTTIKVVLGFFELGLALKFLSNADLVSHWGLLKREVFIGIWVLLALAMTLYLFGVLRFSYHGPKMKLPKIQIGLGVLSLILTLYLFIGLVSKENTLKLLSGFPPPEFYSVYSTKNDCPLNLDCYKDFETGLTMAKKLKKPILLDFTGWACVNCRKIEENVWSQDKIYQILKNEIVLISLYIDDRRKIDPEEQFNFQFPNGRIQKINTIGEKWAAFQSLNFNTASQPYYVLMQADGTLLNAPIQYTDADTYYNWLREGLKLE